MAAARRQVFVEKVLKRLFPCEPRDQEERVLPPAAPEAPPEKARCRCVPPVAAGGGTEAPPGRRLYTAALPPEGYVPAPVPQEPSEGSGSESTCESTFGIEEDAGDQEPRDQPKRRRRRKHKTKKTFKNPNNVHVEQAEMERPQTFPQETLQPQHTGGPTISKNKKRKLKKKQQVKRKKAAGLLTKASGISFLYEPREDSCELGDKGKGDAGDLEDTGDTEAKGADPGIQGKADGILDFLKSTQEMYLYDGVSQDPDPAFLGAAEELFTGLEARSMSAADLLGLEQLKALLLLQDPERLQHALQVFSEHCAMPPDQAGVVSALFNYWATHMFPERSQEGSRAPWLPGSGAQQGAMGSPGGPAGHLEGGTP
ncbi:glutamate-rich protein 1 isoform X2 [Sturnira hondurensis]|uniref:glutamate-rich protein 1 isoform X2 n=1 Tax=Sturnira hondurensis TaxID=192404 RepID=UPI001879034B|nr:glutamate-rich protein 1 isoform X2 [Sturnira hondurensis]